MAETQSLTVSDAEVTRFGALAGRWWDPSGPMGPLHAMNPARVGWIDTRIRGSFPEAGGLRVLDIGCGAGLLTEALARRGYDVLGLDASGEAIAAAKAHAADQGALGVSYRAGCAEDLVAEGVVFPVVTALEVIEHVPDPAQFVRVLARLVAPGGLLFVSTLNRTTRAFLTAKLGAEYVLRLLPIGTHNWRRFVAPAELGGFMRQAGLHLADIAGMHPDPLRGGWRTGGSLAVNYIAMGRK